MDLTNILLSPNGRIGRQPYWIAILVLLGANMVANFIPVVGQIASLVSIYFYVCVYSKRLHDLGMSGFVQIIAWLLSLAAFIGAIVMIIPTIITMAQGGVDDAALLREVLLGSGAVIGLSLLSMTIIVAFVVWLGVAPGQRGPNPYGPDPRDPLETAAI